MFPLDEDKKKRREIQAERTKIDIVAFEVLQELVLLKRNDAYVRV
jgi:hypothetical protein